MKNYRNRLYVSQLQKVYSQISEATVAIMRDENVDNFFETSAILEQVYGVDPNTNKGVGGFMKFMSNYFKVNKYNCLNSSPPCVLVEGETTEVYRSISGNNLGAFTVDDESYCVQTVNGASICGVGLGSPQGGLMWFFVDVNGISGPNIAGRDLFLMSVQSDGSVVDGFVASGDPSTPASECNSGTSIDTAAAGCLNAIIDAGWKMEY